MTELPKPPKMYGDFIERYPELGRAWSLMAEAGRNGPIDERTARLVKLGVAMAALREGAVHAGVRKALAMGISKEEIE
jgi:4-carboxymuconolactone decarboxylase